MSAHILFLDDDETRWARFQSKVPYAIRFATAEGLIEYLKHSSKAQDKIDWLFLDHDLGGEHYVDSAREDCGMEVVRHLVADVELHKTKISKIVVHSHNGPAAEEMDAKLKDAGYDSKRVPFMNLLDALTNIG